MTKRLLGIASVLALIHGCSSDDGESLDVSETSCSVKQDDDGNATIDCPDGTSVTVDSGERGEPGEDGKKGQDGDPGKKGEPGADGKDGDTGKKGDPGVQGEPGQDGETGPKGDPGQDGTPGVDGDPGQDGEPGKSCSVQCDDEQTMRIFCEDGSEVTQPVESCTEQGGPLGLVPAATVFAGALGDATNPGLSLRLTTGGAPIEELSVTAVSADETVLPSANIAIEGEGRNRTLVVDPIATGSTTITLTVTNAEQEEAEVSVDYAVSGQVADPSGRYHYGISDASTAIDVGDGYMLLAGDGDNLIGLYHQDVSGPPLKVWDFTADEQLGETPVRIEASGRRGPTIVWLGSHANAPNGDPQVRARVTFGTTITGSGAEVELSFAGRYGGGPGTDEEVADLGLWKDAIDQDVADGFGWGADVLGLADATQPGVIPGAPDGFKIEAFEFENDAYGPNGDSTTTTTGYVSTGRFGSAIISVANILDLVNGVGGQSGQAEFDTPLFPINANVRSIRGMSRNASGDFLIVTSPPSDGAIPGDNDVWELYTWDGSVLHDAVLNQVLPNPDFVVGGEWEGIASVPDPLVPGAKVRLIADSGDTDFYGTGKTTDLEKPLQKSYSQEFTLN